MFLECTALGVQYSGQWFEQMAVEVATTTKGGAVWCSAAQCRAVRWLHTHHLVQSYTQSLLLIQSHCSLLQHGRSHSQSQHSQMQHSRSQRFTCSTFRCSAVSGSTVRRIAVIVVQSVQHCYMQRSHRSTVSRSPVIQNAGSRNAEPSAELTVLDVKLAHIYIAALRYELQHVNYYL